MDIIYLSIYRLFTVTYARHFANVERRLSFRTLRSFLFSPVHAGDKVEFNTVDFVESRLLPKPATNRQQSRQLPIRSTVLPVCSVRVQSDMNKVDHVEFNFVASVYRALLTVTPAFTSQHRFEVHRVAVSVVMTASVCHKYRQSDKTRKMTDMYVEDKNTQTYYRQPCIIILIKIWMYVINDNA